MFSIGKEGVYLRYDEKKVALYRKKEDGEHPWETELFYEAKLPWDGTPYLFERLQEAFKGTIEEIRENLEELVIETNKILEAVEA
jgi:hypothetical protein